MMTIFVSGGIAVDMDTETQNTEQPGKKERPVLRALLKILGIFMLFLVETVLLVVLGLYGVMYVVAKGPSPSARDLFVMSVRETSAAGFLANLFFSEEEIAQIENKQGVEDYQETDTSLIQLPQPTEDPTDATGGPVPDAWGLVDEDGDGVILESVAGEGYTGHMLVVLDPSRVIMGTVPSSYGRSGYTVALMAEKFDAVAGINAGGFEDPDGNGNGSIPDAMVVCDGKVYYWDKGMRKGFVGFDSKHILHVGKPSYSQIAEQDIQCGVCFGPVLISNGEAVEGLNSGVNPRTAIGQRSDGAVLLLVIEGRQVTSLGATFQDLIDIFLKYGAVNACNLDGGSSSMLWYEGEYVNSSSSMVGIRPVPTTFLVLKEGGDSNE